VGIEERSEDEQGGAMPRLTKRIVDAIRPATRELVVKDGELPGFGIRVKPSGRSLYFLHYRNAQGRQRKVAVGLQGVLTPDEARRRARALLAEVAKGGDPAEAKRDRRHGATVADLADRFLCEHVESKRKPSTAVGYRSVLRRYILPALGRLKVVDVTRVEVGKLHLALRDTPFNANRTMAVLSRMFTLAEKWGLRADGTNPCRHIERYRERKRERFLSDAELARLGEALAEAEGLRLEPPAAIAALRLLILTGARRGEILGLRWEEVDFDGYFLRLADSKSGAKSIPLNTKALEILAKLARERSDSPWVIEGQKRGQPFVGLHRVWERIRERAGLDGVRIHDLRHSYASVAAGAGASLPIIGRILGHTVPTTTNRYAHLADVAVRQLNERVGTRIDAALRGTPDAEVIPLRPSR
jgi:integrase